MLGAFSGCGQTYRMGSAGMEPTIKRDQVILVDRAAYHRQSPERWDIVALSAGKNDSPMILRLWGLPGETITLDRTGLRVNGLGIDLPQNLESTVDFREVLSRDSLPHVEFPYTISPNAFFVVGDNLRNSYDSRYWGEVPTNWLLGKVVLR